MVSTSEVLGRMAMARPPSSRRRIAHDLALGPGVPADAGQAQVGDEAARPLRDAGGDERAAGRPAAAAPEAMPRGAPGDPGGHRSRARARRRSSRTTPRCGSGSVSSEPWLRRCVGGRAGGDTALGGLLVALRARLLRAGRHGRATGLLADDPEADHAVHDAKAVVEPVEQRVVALELEQLVVGLGLVVDLVGDPALCPSRGRRRWSRPSRASTGPRSGWPDGARQGRWRRAAA